tara:strand:- start:316 stop:483 length:168 start_codon:yes stop_codon:yes gene_type:complete
MTKRNEQEIIAAFTHMATAELGGTIQHLTTYDSQGTTSKKIIIEYDIENNKREII